MCKPFINGLECANKLKTGYCPYSHDGIVKKTFQEAIRGYIEESKMEEILREDNPQEYEVIIRRNLIRYSQKMTEEEI